ncbi:MAG: hypothetical protein WEA80_01730 [Gemmatimonadaceae bacterium]
MAVTALCEFWMAMVYSCDHCGLRVPFLLEDGCEGPRDGGTKMVPWPEHFAPTGGRKPGDLYPWPVTASGRLVLPVPFIAAACPRCQDKADGESRALSLPCRSRCRPTPAASR